MRKIGAFTAVILWLSAITLIAAEIIDNLPFELDLDFNSNITESVQDKSRIIKIINSKESSQSSPYQAIPGTYTARQNAYYMGKSHYNPAAIYAKYLDQGAYLYQSANCTPYYKHLPRVSSADIAQAFAYANQAINIRYPEYANTTHYKDTAHKEVEGHLLELASEYFAKFKCFSKYQLSTYLPTLSIGNHYYYANKKGDASCLPYYNADNYKCYPHLTSKYRTIDGSCNNPKFPYWGRSLTCHIRLLPADYSDGIQEIRMSSYGYPLPNPRMISNYVTPNKDLKAYYTTLMLAWGQFINHDISNTESHVSNPTHKIDCCLRPDNKCKSIIINNKNDYILEAHKTNCFNFMRSSPCPLCKFGPREQLNAQTSFLDGSQVYGATLKESHKLRSFQKGQLTAYTDRYGYTILPPSTDAKPCSPSHNGLICFIAGDNRVNQHPILLTMHTLLMRNHNHHALKLAMINPYWTDEQLFQEARRINIAEIQHITYNEYLPVILGPLLMNYYKLYPSKDYSHYEVYTDPSSWNEFISAASRYGHSQIKDFYQRLSVNYRNNSIITLRETFFEPGFAYDGLLEDIIRGSLSEPADSVDPYFSHTAKNFIMRAKTQPHGLDLVATNIQRGRDHGIPGYVHFLKACFNYDANTWDDLSPFIPAEVLERFKKIYSTVQDIDLYIAGVSERHFIDAAIGPTFGCLVGIQFYHIKYGDRYFYEHAGQSGSFTPAQLSSIKRSASLARLLCRTSKNLYYIQPKPFYLPSRYNQQIDCRQYPEINYQLWK